MNSDEENQFESWVRLMRDALYGKPTTQNNWDSCKEAWIKDADWLEKQCLKLGIVVPFPEIT